MRIPALLLGLLASLCTYSQKELLPGYIVTNSGDSLHGTVEYSYGSKNPQSITFIPVGGQPKIYSITDLIAVEITGKAKYTRAIVSISTRPDDIAALKKFAMDSIRVDTVLLKNLVSGSWNLFQLVDFKEHYYLRLMAVKLPD